jgi:O-antigen/teichoic acid export membrane protein
LIPYNPAIKSGFSGTGNKIVGYARVAALLASAVGVRLAGAVIGLVLQILLARMLTPAEMGGWFLIVSLASFAGLIIGAGYPTLGLTALARYHALHRPDMAHKFLYQAVRDMLKWALVMFLPGLLFLLVAPVESETRLAVIAGLAIAPASALLRLNGSAANAVRGYMTAILPDFVGKAGLMLAGVIIWIVLFDYMSLPVVAGMFLILSYLTAWVVGRLLGSNGATLTMKDDVPPMLMKAWAHRAWPMIVVALSMTAMADFLTLVSTLLLAKHEVAQVGLAIRLAALVGFFTQASQQFVLRDLTGALRERDANHVRTLLMRTNLACAGVIAAGLIGFAIFGKWGLMIFGPDYVPAYTVLLLLMVAQGIRALGGLNVHLLSLRGKQMMLGRACISSFVIIAASAVLLVPAFHIEAIGWAAIIGELVWSGAVAVLAARHVGWRGDFLALFSGSNQIGRKPLQVKATAAG